MRNEIAGNTEQEDILTLAREYGIDISLIENNLQKTVAERILSNERALNIASELRKAGKKYYAKLKEHN